MTDFTLKELESLYRTTGATYYKKLDNNDTIVEAYRRDDNGVWNDVTAQAVAKQQAEIELAKAKAAAEALQRKQELLDRLKGKKKDTTTRYSVYTQLTGDPFSWNSTSFGDDITKAQEYYQSCIDRDIFKLVRLLEIHSDDTVEILDELKTTRPCSPFAYKC